MKWFLILALATVLLALLLPPDVQTLHRLHTTTTTYRLAVAVVLLPYLLIWYAGFYAFAKLQEYSKPLKNTGDGAAFHIITIGMGALAFSLVVPTIISLILGSIAMHYPGLKTASTIFNNYLAIFPGLVAFLILYNGSLRLVRTLGEKRRQLDLRWHALWFLLLAATFTHLTIVNHYQTNPYHLSTGLLIITFIVPYLYGWMVGLLGAYELHAYAYAVKGILYRRGVRQFAQGIAVVIVGSIAFQFVNITIAQRFISSLGAIAVLQFLLLALVAAGLVLMALGTKKLKSIEEVK